MASEVDMGYFKWDDVKRVPQFPKELPILKMDFHKSCKTSMSELFSQQYK